MQIRWAGAALVAACTPFSSTSSTDAGSATDAGGVSSYAAAVLASRPRAYWRLGESGGTVAHDMVAAHDGKLTDVTLGLSGALAGDPDTAAGFDGAGSAMVVSGFPPVTVPFAVELWMRTTSMDFPVVVQQGDASNEGFRVSLGDGAAAVRPGQMDFRAGGGNFVGATSLTYNDGNWHHVVVTHDGGSVRFYKDGAPDGTVTSSEPVIASQKALSVGVRIEQPDGTLYGALDEVAIYDHVLSDADVAAHYARAAARR